MLPTLPGIRELVKVMRSDRSEYIHSDILASTGLRYDFDFVDPSNVCKTVIPNSAQRNTHAGQAYDATTDASLPDVMRDTIFHFTEPKPDVASSEFHEFPNFTENSASFSEMRTVQTPKPVYTVLTSKNKLHSTNPDTRISRINKISKSIMTPPKPSYTVLRSNTTFPSARSNPDPINTGPNEPLKPATNQPASRPTKLKFHMVLPKPIHPKKPDTKFSSASPLLYQLLKVNTPSTTSASMISETQLTSPHLAIPTSNKNTSCSSARTNPTNSMLHQLLKPSIALNTSHSVTSGTPITSPNPMFAVPTSNTSLVIARDGQFPPTRPNHNLANSGLDTLPKSNSNYTIHKSCPQQSPIQAVTIVPSTKHPQSSSSSERQNCCTKPVIKASTKSNSSQSTSKQVESCVAHESSCDGSLSDVKVTLAREDLWKLFYDQGNEMIVAKNGRPMFPTLDVSVSGLVAHEMYSISVMVVCVDKYRYHFSTSCEMWEPTYEDRHQPVHSRCFEHPASPANGYNWSEKSLSFRELRLTNSATKAKNMVHVPTLRKHRIQLVVTMLRCSRCRTQHTRYIDMPLTEFIAVSSYYNVKVTQLKITHNPLAKTRRKRKNRNRQSPEDVPTLEIKKQKTGEDTANTLSETNPLASALLPQPINSSDSTHVTMLHNEHLSTVPHLSTSGILQSTSNSQLPTILSFVAPSVLQNTSSSLNILPSTSSSQLPPLSSQATIISSSVGIEPARPFLPLSTSTYPQPVINATGNSSQNNLTSKEQCNTVYTCQTTKPTAHVQTDDDILEYIKIYLSPFLTSEKNETFDSSVFDELFNVNYISEKLDNFDLIQHLPLC